MKLINLLLLSSTLLFSSLTSATELDIENAYLRATPPHVTNSAAFMIIHNNSDTAVKLISISSDIAQRIELHHHTMTGAMMIMSQVKAIEIDANNSAELKPGGFHIMLFGLKSPLTEGDSVKLTLHFSNGDEITIDTPVKRIIMHNKIKHNH